MISIKEDKTTLIIGGSSGIGLEVAKLSLERGRRVIIVSREKEKLTEVLLLLKPKGDIQGYNTDVTNITELNALFMELKNQPIHELVNAAGVFSPKPFLDHDPSDYDKYSDITKALFFVTQYVVKNNMLPGGGAIVNIGSMWLNRP